jgi:hypothetical protein
MNDECITYMLLIMPVNMTAEYLRRDCNSLEDRKNYCVANWRTKDSEQKAAEHPEFNRLSNSSLI